MNNKALIKIIFIIILSTGCQSVHSRKIVYTPQEYANYIYKLQLSDSLNIDTIDFLPEENSNDKIQNHIQLEDAPFLIDETILDTISPLTNPKTDKMEKVTELKLRASSIGVSLSEARQDKN